MSKEDKISRLEDQLSEFAERINTYAAKHADYPETNDEGRPTQNAQMEVVNGSDDTCEADSEAERMWDEYASDPTTSTLQDVAAAEKQRAEAWGMELHDDENTLMQEINDLDD